MTKLSWRRPVHQRAGKETEDRATYPGIMEPLLRNRPRMPRGQRARAALAEATARTAEPAPVIIAEWPISRSGETLRVFLSEFQGRFYVHARRFYRNESGDLQPGKGLGVGVDNLPALARAFAEALIKARELGLVDAK